MGRLEGKVAIVTGAASGIGRATALLFAQEGAKVVVADVDPRGQDVAAEITSAGGTALFVRTDVSQPEDVEALVRTTVDTYGTLDIMVNNAGVEGEQRPTADCTVENWDRVLNVNLKGVFLGMKYAIPAMLRAGGGSIVNTASTAGLTGYPSLPAYAASKGGVIQLTKTAALEYARTGIRVNCICPGGILTPLVERFTAGLPQEQIQKMVEAAHPVGRFGKPEEVALLALFLASDESAFCTGAPFIIDGGMTAQ